MVVSGKRTSLARQGPAALALAAGLLFGSDGWTQVRSASALFEVRVSPASTPFPRRALCSSDTHAGAFGAEVTVVCSTGAVAGIAESNVVQGPTHGGARRYMLQVTRGDQHVGQIDAHTTSGTIIGWQVVRLPSREYVELTLGW